MVFPQTKRWDYRSPTDLIRDPKNVPCLRHGKLRFLICLGCGDHFCPQCPHVSLRDRAWCPTCAERFRPSGRARVLTVAKVLAFASLLGALLATLGPYLAGMPVLFVLIGIRGVPAWRDRFHAPEVRPIRRGQYADDDEPARRSRAA